jgi:predicted transcriptional regulator
MVAPAYAEKRRNLAVSIGLGRKGGRRKAVANAAPATPKVMRKPRAKKAPA